MGKSGNAAAIAGDCVYSGWGASCRRRLKGRTVPASTKRTQNSEPGCVEGGSAVMREIPAEDAIGRPKVNEGAEVTWKESPMQAFHEIRLQRAQLFAKQAGGLAGVTLSEPKYHHFFAHGEERQ